MTKRFITLAGGQQVSLAAYVQAINTAKAEPDQNFKRGLCGWWPVKGSEIVQEFRAGLTDRINRHANILVDRRGATARVLARLRVVGRDCKWCGSRFTVNSINDRFCDSGCRRSYDS